MEGVWFRNKIVLLAILARERAVLASDKPIQADRLRTGIGSAKLSLKLNRTVPLSLGMRSTSHQWLSASIIAPSSTRIRRRSSLGGTGIEILRNGFSTKKAWSLLGFPSFSFNHGIWVRASSFCARANAGRLHGLLPWDPRIGKGRNWSRQESLAYWKTRALVPRKEDDIMCQICDVPSAPLHSLFRGLVCPRCRGGHPE